jgi:HEAT repeat protein
LQACEALLEAGEVEQALPLFKYLAYECHDESSQKAIQRLLFLKEVAPVVPLLAHLSTSDGSDMCYHACLALALVNQPAATCHTVARPRHSLAISILDKRLHSYQDARHQFCQAGLNALDHLPTTDQQSQAYQQIARLALNMLADSGVSSNQTNTIGQLLNSQSPPVVVNAALFDLRAGRFERSHHALLNLLSQTTQPLSLPVHLKALTTLGQIVSPQTTTLLLEALEDQKSRIRSRAASLLGPLGEQTAVQPLINALNDRNTAVPRSAAEALGTLGNPVAVPPLIEALNDEDENVREEVAGALGELGDIVALQPLLTVLYDEHDRVRAGAVRALAELGTPEVLQPVLAALEDESAQVALPLMLWVNWMIQLLCSL